MGGGGGATNEIGDQMWQDERGREEGGCGDREAQLAGDHGSLAGGDRACVGSFTKDD